MGDVVSDPAPRVSLSTIVFLVLVVVTAGDVAAIEQCQTK